MLYLGSWPTHSSDSLTPSRKELLCLGWLNRTTNVGKVDSGRPIRKKRPHVCYQDAPHSLIQFRVRLQLIWCMMTARCSSCPEKLRLEKITQVYVKPWKLLVPYESWSWKASATGEVAMAFPTFASHCITEGLRTMPKEKWATNARKHNRNVHENQAKKKGNRTVPFLSRELGNRRWFNQKSFTGAWANPLHCSRKLWPFWPSLRI